MLVAKSNLRFPLVGKNTTERSVARVHPLVHVGCERTQRVLQKSAAKRRE